MGLEEIGMKAIHDQQRLDQLRATAKDDRVRNGVSLYEDPNDWDMICGNSSELAGLREVYEIKERLKKITTPDILNHGVNLPVIDLDNYSITIKRVSKGAKPPGFDFMCSKPEQLMRDMIRWTPTDESGIRDQYQQIQKVFNNDKESGAMGMFCGMMTNGTGFRQISQLTSLHIAISLSGVCNAHIDRVGIVDAAGHFNLANFPGHGVIDLGPYIPGLRNLYFDELGGVFRPGLSLFARNNDQFGQGTWNDFHSQTKIDPMTGPGFTITYNYIKNF